MPKVPSTGRELTRRLSSCNPTTTRNKSKHGSLQVNIAATPKRPVPPFWVLSALPLRILKDNEDPVTLASVSEAIVEEVASLGNHRDKPIIEYDPEIEKTLKKNRNRVKAQRALQFEQQEANSDEGASEKFSEEEIVEENSKEEIQDNMADNANNQRRTLADYTNPTTASCGSSIVWPTVDANNFELKPALV
ncbi:hypothetical protein PIB30_066871 [Stylosanthes scabra]|uniref:Uncharacterized protein n=1 Tax=Stylosanthes scabra TaxID=79078 RepID=A0ABU6ZL80_9FABA|nr:hypothetical protein [Stylosanthes scabra]